ncbi:MAG: TetR/AcrR family transcriptional regulator [Planctomycetota bacterium]
MSARERLLRSTRDLLWARGYESTSPGAIQREAGVGQGSFYHHFDGKLDLAGQALDSTSSEMVEAFDRTVADAGDDPLDALVAYLALERDALRGCRLGRHAIESSIEEERLRAPVRAYFEHVERGLAQLLAALEADGRLAPGLAPPDLAASMVAGVQGAYVLARVHGEPERLAAALRGVRQLLLAAMRGGASSH